MTGEPVRDGVLESSAAETTPAGHAAHGGGHGRGDHPARNELEIRYIDATDEKHARHGDRADNGIDFEAGVGVLIFGVEALGIRKQYDKAGVQKQERQMAGQSELALQGIAQNVE